MTIKQERRKQYSLRLTFFKGHLWVNIFKLKKRLQVECGFRLGKNW